MESKAYFEFSKEEIGKRFLEVKELSDIPAYSVKTNPDIVNFLEKTTSCMFSIHTKNSVARIKNKKRILFFLQGVKEGNVSELIGKGIDKFVVDNKTDLDLVLKEIKGTDHQIDLFLRMKMKENTISTGKYFVYGLRTDTIKDLLHSLKSNVNIDKIGIHFHRKTQNIGEWNIKNEIKDSYSDDFFDLVDILNIGGGLPVKYKNYNFSETLIDNIKEKIREVKKFANNYNIKLMLEPGRYIAAPPGKLVTNIISIQKDTIIVDASVYNCAMDTFVADIKLPVRGEKTDGRRYTIKGCTPDAMDIFRYKVYLKDKPRVGEQIIFENAGAYIYSSNFCDLEKLPVKFKD